MNSHCQKDVCVMLRGIANTAREKRIIIIIILVYYAEAAVLIQ